MAAPSAAEREVLHQAHMLKTLTETPGWKIFVDMLQNRVDMEATIALGKTESIDQVFAKEFAKGTFNGLRLAMELPSITIQTAQDIRQAYGVAVTGSARDVDEDSPPNAPSHPVGQSP